ncbi:hypothetical protein NtRootA2_28030 [Arthrobacter sp. NtRootA2]|nr:hypothetical protein NtRootA2_28030 [Arthrobacter sp. NtRootA2]
MGSSEKPRAAVGELFLRPAELALKAINNDVGTCHCGRQAFACGDVAAEVGRAVDMDRRPRWRNVPAED